MFLPLKKKKFTTFSFEIHKVESRAVPSPHPPFNFRETCPITVILHTQKQTRVSQCVSVYVQNPDSSKKENKNTDRIVKLRGPSSKHTHTNPGPHKKPHIPILKPTSRFGYSDSLSLSLKNSVFFFPIQYHRPPSSSSSSFSPVPSQVRSQITRRRFIISPSLSFPLFHFFITSLNVM